MDKERSAIKPGMARLNVEITRDLHKRAKQLALDTDKDLRTVVIEALEQHVAGKAKKGGGR